MRSVSNILHLCLNNIWAPGTRHVCIRKSSIFVCFFLRETHFRHQQGHQRAVALLGSIIVIQKTNVALNVVGNRSTQRLQMREENEKKRERSHTGRCHRETSEEKKKSKIEDERTGGHREISDERRERKRRERFEAGGGHRETSEERRERKRRERTEAGGHRKTSEEQREMKRREKDQKVTYAERRQEKKL